ncbi:hypothetical protein HMPREF3223_00029 [Cutibacterium avidum]|nr:hypothetical protein HMPREF3223_00029 [Cutibacterium avidum]
MVSRGIVHPRRRQILPEHTVTGICFSAWLVEPQRSGVELISARLDPQVMVHECAPDSLPLGLRVYSKGVDVPMLGSVFQGPVNDAQEVVLFVDGQGHAPVLRRTVQSVSRSSLVVPLS